MKYAVLFSVVVSLLALTSCEKEYCWKCTTTRGAPENPAFVRSDELCNKTEKDISSYQLANSSVTWVTPDSAIYTSTTCQKQ